MGTTPKSSDSDRHRTVSKNGKDQHPGQAAPRHHGATPPASRRVPRLCEARSGQPRRGQQNHLCRCEGRGKRDQARQVHVHRQGLVVNRGAPVDGASRGGGVDGFGGRSDGRRDSGPGRKAVAYRSAGRGAARRKCRLGAGLARLEAIGAGASDQQNRHNARKEHK